MKNLSFLTIILLSILTTGLFSCKSGDNKQNEEVKISKLNAENETEALLDFFEQSGNYINSTNIPALVLAGEVFDNLKEYKLIDIRSKEDYIAGHLEGAINLKTKEVLSYLKHDIYAVSFEKIVIISNSGFDASYVTSILRLLGYGNVYTLKYGMSSWNKDFAKKYWGENTSSKYASNLETSENIKLEKTAYPKLNTGKFTAYEILEARADTLLDSLNFRINADVLFENLSNYYIVNYWPNFQYEKGHIPGAVQYTPRESLVRDSSLLTLPSDKAIVLYEYTGHHSAFATAYLQILGYDAHTLEYGTNALMYSQLESKQIGRIFKMSNVNDFSILKGAYATTEEKQMVDSIIKSWNTNIKMLNRFWIKK